MSTATPVRPGRDRAGAPPAPAQTAAPPAVPPGRVARLLRGPAGDPGWARPGLLVLLAGTALLYLWDLSASGYANDFYAAAVQAGTQSWKAWLFGSLDSGNAITVDKPPAALWVMTASARLFGFSSWSLLVPQALMGVGAVALLHATVRRWAGPAAGLLAGAVLALTPAAVLMFRFDNPDALLTLLLVAAAWAGSRAVDAASVRASTWWLVAAGSAVGSAFLTKMGQALLVVRRSGWCTWSPARRGCGPGSCRWAPRWRRWSSLRGGSSRWWSCGPRPTAPTSAGRRRTRCSSSRWATTASAGCSAAPATVAVPAGEAVVATPASAARPVRCGCYR
ncbi:Dolichyl-phosphate-mannose-protein mannosyltransferase [Pseudonocardia autotrophica]|nr:Dolichyl-phosphate-mannose-protein mannosyltransferase [Pseudonocardia autotrophica]